MTLLQAIGVAMAAGSTHVETLAGRLPLASWAPHPDSTLDGYETETGRPDCRLAIKGPWTTLGTTTFRSVFPTH
jgi:hypothetical protein